MKGYAIEVRLLEWKKSDQHKEEGTFMPLELFTVFKELKSHYLGSFSSQTAEITYKRLSSILAHTNPVIRTKMRRQKRSKLST